MPQRTRPYKRPQDSLPILTINAVYKADHPCMAVPSPLFEWLTITRKSGMAVPQVRRFDSHDLV
jgi:hypothetical protein